MFRAIKIVGTIVSFPVGSIGTLHRMDKQGQVDPVAVEEESTQMVRNIFEKLLKMAGVTVEVRGYENIPQDRPVLYVGNHRSYFDILVGYTTVPGLMGFVAKKEMEKIPLLSKWMLNVNCLFLDRNNIKEGLKMILAGIEKVRRGVSVWIFPEGTRNKNEQLSDLLPFKEGSLKIAEKSGCPVVPVAIKGTAEVFEKHIPLICPSHVVIEFGEPFIVKELDRRTGSLSAHIREKRSQGCFQRWKGEQLRDGLLEIRGRLDQIDTQIEKLFEERMRLCSEVAEYKIATGKAVYDAEREKQKIDQFRRWQRASLTSRRLPSCFADDDAEPPVSVYWKNSH